MNKDKCDTIMIEIYLKLSGFFNKIGNHFYRLHVEKWHKKRGSR